MTPDLAAARALADQAIVQAREALEAAQSARRALGEEVAAPAPGSKLLTDKDIQDAAALLPVDVPALMAVAKVESPTGGFASDGRPVVLFEPHVFSRLTGHRYDATQGGVSYKVWGSKPYPRGTLDERNAANWAKIDYASGLDRAAAIQSASYGRFQVMGFNWKVCGFSGPEAFFQAMHVSEREHLLACVNYIKGNGLDDELRAHRWADFAAGYNGKNYAKNSYDTKLQAAFLAAGGKP